MRLTKQNDDKVVKQKSLESQQAYAELQSLCAA